MVYLFIYLVLWIIIIVNCRINWVVILLNVVGCMINIYCISIIKCILYFLFMIFGIFKFILNVSFLNQIIWFKIQKLRDIKNLIFLILFDLDISLVFECVFG